MCSSKRRPRIQLSCPQSLETRKLLSAVMKPTVDMSGLSTASKVAQTAIDAVDTSQIDADKLTDIAGLKERATKVEKGRNVVQETVRANEQLASSEFDAMRNSESDRSRNPVGNQNSPLKGSKISQVSDDTDAASEPSRWEAFKTWVGSVFGSAAGGAGAKTTTGNGAGAVGGTALGILTANTESPESKRNEAEGIWGLFRLGKKGTSNRNADDQLDQLKYDGSTPNPEADPPSSGIITQEQIDELYARWTADKEFLDTPQEGGPVNTSLTPTGRLGTLGLWTAGSDLSVSTPTKYDQIRIETILTADKTPDQ